MGDDDRYEPWYAEVGRLVLAFGNVEYIVTLLARAAEVPAHEQPKKFMVLGDRLSLIEKYILDQPYMTKPLREELRSLASATRAFAKERRNLVAHNPICAAIYVNHDESEMRVGLEIASPTGGTATLTFDELVQSRKTAQTLTHRWGAFHSNRAAARTAWLLPGEDKGTTG